MAIDEAASARSLVEERRYTLYDSFRPDEAQQINLFSYAIGRVEETNIRTGPWLPDGQSFHVTRLRAVASVWTEAVTRYAAHTSVEVQVSERTVVATPLWPLLCNPMDVDFEIGERQSYKVAIRAREEWQAPSPILEARQAVGVALRLCPRRALRTACAIRAIRAALPESDEPVRIWIFLDGTLRLSLGA